MKRKYILLPPELTDGQHTTIHRKGGDWDPTVLGETLEQWLADAAPGDTIELEVVEFTDEQVEAMPEI